MTVNQSKCFGFSKKVDFRTPPGFDRTRNVEIGNKNYKLEHLEEAFTSEHWIVRIFKVKEPSNR
jgi:dolichyl-diphosphooligosaccharide--protein glycosyltransferase